MRFLPKSLVTVWALLVLCSLASCGYLIKPKVKTDVAQLAPGTYQLDPQHTSVLFNVNHMGLSTFVGRFDQVDASLEFTPKRMADAKLSAIITMSSLDVNNRDLETTLKGSSWLDTDTYPQALFTTTSVEMLDEKTARFNGNLTLHGITAPIVLEVVFNGAGDNLLTGRYTLGFSASTHFKRSTFGIDFLIPAVGDEITVEVFAEFQKR